MEFGTHYTILQHKTVGHRDKGWNWGHFHTFQGPLMADALEWEDSDSCASPTPPTQKVYCCNQELMRCAGKSGVKGGGCMESIEKCALMCVCQTVMKYLVAYEAQGREGFGWPSPQLLVWGKWGLLHQLHTIYWQSSTASKGRSPIGKHKTNNFEIWTNASLFKYMQSH